MEWYRSYLTGCTLRAKCNTESSNKPTYSRTFPIEFGTPQGSCLGPLLFLIFTNDLYRNISFCQCILFADDTTIYFTHENLKFLHDCLEIDLEHLNDLFLANTLTLNFNKSQTMSFLHKNCKVPLIKFDDVALPETTEFKFLGVWFDSKLELNSHINRLILKLKRNSNLLKNSKNFLNNYALSSVYYAHTVTLTMD